MKKILISLMVSLLLGLPAQMYAQAQDPAQSQNQDQSPVQIGPGVARVSFIHGNVSTQQGDSGDWNAATLNTPVVAGDQVSTGANSRAEIQLDYANVLRLDQNSVAKVANLTQTQLQVQVAEGVANYSMLKGNQAQMEIDTPNVAVHPLQEGQYRIEVPSNDLTRVIVLQGGADVTTPQGSAHVDAGQMMTIQGATNPQYQISDASSSDDFDKWSNSRDKLITNAQSWRYTDPYYTGTQDLDAYGRWVSAPNYGYVWVPAQGPGWAPYSAGRWVWEPYYGWTWLSYEPWGWAPYHYGRWFVYGGSWAWWPGPVYPTYRPVWAPAYVSFFGFGGGWGFGIGFGGSWGYASFGWLPIGPGDWYHPWWGRWGGNRVNITNITNIYNYNNRYYGRPTPGEGLRPLSARGFSNLNSVLTNPRVRQGVSSMPAKDFGRFSVPPQTRSVDPAALRQASAMTGRLPVVPTKASLRSLDRPASPGTIPSRATQDEHFFTRNTPPAPARTFNQQAAEVQKMVASSRTSPNRTVASNGGSAVPLRSATPPQAGWRSFGSSDRGSSLAGLGPPRGQNSTRRSPDTGWRSFSGQTGTRPSQGAQSSRAPSAQKPPENVDQRQTQNGHSAPSARPNPPNTSRKGGDWHSFKPQTPAPRSMPTGPHGKNNTADNSARPGWQSFSSRSGGGSQPGAASRAREPSYNRGQQAGNYRYSRPPLDLHQPIVRQRPSSSYSGYSRSQGGYRGPRGGNAPSPHPSGNAPSGGGHTGGGGHGGGKGRG